MTAAHPAPGHAAGVTRPQRRAARAQEMRSAWSRALRLTRVATLALACALAACAGGPPAPDWAVNAHGALMRFEAAWLRGDTRIADAEFVRARAELARTGRFDQVAHAELVRCALRVASLEPDDCPGFVALAPDVPPALNAYAAYLTGRWESVDGALLPPQHRAILAGTRTVASLEDPVSRLVAAGALLRAGRIDPPAIAEAVETASAHGWRRPLLAWLSLQAQRARAAGDTAAADTLRRRIDLVGGGAVPAAPAAPPTR